jgi:type IV pilus assembly protein PilV
MNELRSMHDHLEHAQRGFGLVESLVALVVISVGMIGIAALYGQGLRASTMALNRTRAVNLAADMADRIRANRRGEAAFNTASAADRNCDPGDPVDCTAQEMANHDTWRWRAEVNATLPGPGTGTVAFAGGTPPTYTITVNWQEVGGAATYQLVIQLPNR